MAKYKIGDKVRIVDHRTDNMNNFGEMDKWLGKVMTIRDLFLHGYVMEEDYGEYGGAGWYWDDSMISGLAEPERGPCTVELRFDGMITTATLKRGGRDVKTAEARCNPKDTYSRAEGAMVAVERLFEKKKEPKKTSWEPKFGDKFVIIGNSSPRCYHFFDIGEVVTFVERRADTPNCARYISAQGLRQSVMDDCVKPYEGK